MSSLRLTRPRFVALALALVVALAGAVLVATPAEAASSSVSISKVASKTAPYKGKVTIKPNISVSGKVTSVKKTLTVTRSGKTIAKNKTSVKLAAGTYKVTQKVSYRTYATKTTTQKVKKKVVGVAAGKNASVTCTASSLIVDEDYGDTALVASCTSPKFDGAVKLNIDLWEFGSSWTGFDDDSYNELTLSALPEVGVPFTATLNAGDDLYLTKVVTQKKSTKVYSKVKTKTKSQTLVIKSGKKPSSVAGNGGWNCPKDYPIKGNANSGIYHMPGGAYYNKTKPEECFATKAAAESAGYRQSKR